MRSWVCCGVSQLVLLVGCGLIAAGLVVILDVVPDKMKTEIKKNLVLGLNKDGTLNDFTTSWKDPKYVTHMQYWIYDYKNTIGIMNRGINPDPAERGPYSYKQIITHEVEFEPGNENTMEFGQRTSYVFDPDTSCAGCDPIKDTVTIPDTTFIVAMRGFTSPNGLCLLLPPSLQGMLCPPNGGGPIASLWPKIEPMLGLALSAFDTSPFVECTVDQLLFSGYSAPFISKFVNNVINLLKELLNPSLGQFLTPMDPIYFNLNSNNNSIDYYYTVRTGKKDSDKAGFILSFRNGTPTAASSDGSSLPEEWWSVDLNDTSSCSLDNAAKALRLEGTNGDFFKKYIKKTDRLPIFVDDICTTVDLVYDSDVTHYDIPTYRFVLPASTFDYSIPDNCGKCKTLEYGAYELPVNSTCLPSGLLDLSGCQQGAPIIASKPHFRQADPAVQRLFPRFEPSEWDETTMDIEPTTGTILAANKRLQINVFFNQFPEIGSFSVMRPGAYPIVWLNESFYADHDTITSIKDDVVTTKRTWEIVCYTAVGVGGLLIIISLITDFVLCCVGKEKTLKDE